MVKLILVIAALAFFATKCYSKMPATDTEILNLSELMFLNADMRLSKKVTFNIKTTPVLRVNEADLNSIETVRTMRALFDNYQLDSLKAEVVNKNYLSEQDKFLDAVLDTNVMQIVMRFLEKKHVKAVMYKATAAIERQNQKNLLRTLWFTNYSRNKGTGIKGSSGFEHVFCKEVIHKNNATEVSGLHNWIYFHDEEIAKPKHIAFKKITKKPLQLFNNIQIFEYQFSFDSRVKPVTSMFIGTTPELEMAIYTLCVVMGPPDCKVSMGRKRFTIKTFAFSRGDDQMVASAYPAI